MNSTHVKLVLEAKNSQRHAWCLHYFTSPFQNKSWYILSEHAQLWSDLCFSPQMILTPYALYLLLYQCSALKYQTSQNNFLLPHLHFFISHSHIFMFWIHFHIQIHLKQSLTRHNCHVGKLCGTFFGLNLICFSSDSMDHWTLSETLPDSDLHDNTLS